MKKIRRILKIAGLTVTVTAGSAVAYLCVGRRWRLRRTLETSFSGLAAFPLTQVNLRSSDGELLESTTARSPCRNGDSWRRIAQNHRCL
jgi:hypothetical protein